MKIGGKEISGLSECFIIAEIGVNHNGNLLMAKEMIDIALKVGVDAVKFQTFIPEDLYSSKTSQDKIDWLKQYQLNYDQHLELTKYCREKGIIFISTPFDFKSVDLLKQLDIPAFKIASGEINYYEFLKYAALAGKPIIFSSGSSSLGDIEKAKQCLNQAGCMDIAILHCVSAYPACDSSLNLNTITTLKYAFPDCIVGYSDHSLGIEAAIAAVVLGAKIIEKHFTLDKSLDGPDHKASADPDELLNLVKAVRRTESMLGSSIKQFQECEGKNTRSLVASRKITKGEIIQENDIIAKRPYGNLSPEFKQLIVGKRALKNIDFDELIQLNMF